MERPNDKSIKIMGFTNDYYTLWSYYEAWLPQTADNGQVYYYPKSNTTYVQNISMDYDKAVDFMNVKFKWEWEEDLGLRGQYFSRRDRDLFAQSAPADIFKFGKYIGQSIGDSSDVSYLIWYRDQMEGNYPEAHEYVTEVLIAMGELVRYKGEVMTVAQRDRLKHQAIIDSKQGHFFEDGKRVEVEVKVLTSFSFETNWGTCNVVIMQTKSGEVVKYMGSSYPSLSQDEYTKIRGTVNHGQYKGQDQTLLKRISIVK